MENLTIQQKLLKVQTELKAPKNQYNSFGKYNYRNQEDILEAVKPICAKYGINLIVTDDLVELAGTVFVKSTAKVFTDGSEPIIEANGFAAYGERKGMDPAQSTGSSSSYSRKYALNGLFLIDDTKDADSTNTHGKEAAPVSKGKAVLPKSGKTFMEAKKFVNGDANKVAAIRNKYQVTPEVEQLLLS